MGASPSGFDCFYVGGGVGGNLLDGRQTRNSIGALSSGGTSNLFIYELNNNYFNQNRSFEAYTGFGYHCGIFYAGLEVFGQYSHAYSHYEHSSLHLFPLETGPTLDTLSLSNNSSVHMKDHAFTIGINKYL